MIIGFMCLLCCIVSFVAGRITHPSEWTEPDWVQKDRRVNQLDELDREITRLRKQLTKKDDSPRV